LKEILAEEINSKINFDSLNNAINIYNNSQKDEYKKIELVKSFEDFINRREKLKIFSKSIEKIEKKEERKSKLKTEFDSLNNFQTTDIETIIKRYNLEDKFNTKIGNLKTNFEYTEIIKKPKELDSIELLDEEKVKDK
jgi:arginyl-tRNA--protein-N-Asp/Glu arginylyltransferase